jgi:hypothetical protein
VGQARAQPTRSGLLSVSTTEGKHQLAQTLSMMVDVRFTDPDRRALRDANGRLLLREQAALSGATRSGSVPCEVAICRYVRRLSHRLLRSVVLELHFMNSLLHSFEPLAYTLDHGRRQRLPEKPSAVPRSTQTPRQHRPDTG